MLIAYKDYKDGLLIGDNGEIVKLRQDDRRISRAIKVGFRERLGEQEILKRWL